MSPTALALQEETFQLALAEHGVDAYGLNVIASRAALEEDPGLIDGLTAAVVEGYRTACADPRAAARVFLELFPDRDARYVDASLAQVCALVGGDVGLQTVDGWRNTIDLYAAAGLLDGPVAPGRRVASLEVAASLRGDRGPGRTCESWVSRGRSARRWHPLESGATVTRSQRGMPLVHEERVVRRSAWYSVAGFSRG